MPTKLRLLVLVGLGVAATVFLTWMTLNNRDARLSATSTPAAWSVTDARDFDGFPTYYLGESFAGLPLTTIIRDVVNDDPSSPHPTGRDGFLFIYGDCEPKGEQGCAVPLAVRVTPRCYAPPELYPTYLKTDPPRLLDGGAVAQKIAGQEHIWTHEVVVTFSGGEELHDEAIAALEPLNQPALRKPVLASPDANQCGAIQGRDRADVQLPTR
jgi:hypothetical protein